MTEEPRRRFLTIEQAAEELNVGTPIIRGLVKSGELRGIQIGGRGYLGQIFGSSGFLPGVTALRAYGQ